MDRWDEKESKKSSKYVKKAEKILLKISQIQSRILPNRVKKILISYSEWMYKHGIRVNALEYFVCVGLVLFWMHSGLGEWLFGSIMVGNEVGLDRITNIILLIILLFLSPIIEFGGGGKKGKKKHDPTNDDEWITPRNDVGV